MPPVVPIETSSRRSSGKSESADNDRKRRHICTTAFRDTIISFTFPCSGSNSCCSGVRIYGSNMGIGSGCCSNGDWVAWRSGRSTAGTAAAVGSYAEPAWGCCEHSHCDWRLGVCLLYPAEWSRSLQLRSLQWAKRGQHHSICRVSGVCVRVCACVCACMCVFMCVGSLLVSVGLFLC